MVDEKKFRFRLSSTVELELVFDTSSLSSVGGAVGNDHAINQNRVDVSCTSDGGNFLNFASLTNFTGRIVVHRADENNEETNKDTTTTTAVVGVAKTPVVSQHGAPRTDNDSSEEEYVLEPSSSKKKKHIKKKQVSFDDENESMPSESFIPRRRLSKETSTLILRAIGQILTRRNIPLHIRQKRVRTSVGSSDSSPPPMLHDLCCQPNVTLEELYDCLSANPDVMKQKDGNGRYPLHVMSDNVALITSAAGRKTATAFCTHLIQEFPDAALAPDRNGTLPFFYLIADWVEDVNDTKKFEGDEGSTEYSQQEFSGIHYPGTAGLSLTSLRRRSSSDAQHSGHFFPRAELYEEVEWCFSMLSIEIDVLGRNYASPTLRRSMLRKRRVDTRAELVEQLALYMPLLVRTVLLVDDDGIDSRVKVLNSTVFRRLLICPLIVDRWLVRMLKHGGVPSKRGVDFLTAISQTTIDDYTGGFGAPLPNDWVAFKETKDEVFNLVSNLKGTVACLVTMKKEEIERAASTSVIWHTMSEKLSRPFVLGLVLIDLVLHLTLMVAFRNEAGVQPLVSTHDDGPISQNVIYIICGHYLMRKVCELWALLALSLSAFWSYFLNMWTLFELFAVILTIITTTLNRHVDTFHNGLNAFVVGLLWIKVLAFLKVVNREMATFVLSLTQILSDIRFFMVVLVVCVFMFGDMFHISVNGKDDGLYCDDEEKENGAIEDFCSSSWESYLRVYAILIGDFEYSDMTATTGTAILFVIFTVFGVIILLNVLIAVISDSYEKATLSSNVLFGRARVMFVAQNDSLESFLKPPPNPRRGGDHTNEHHVEHHPRSICTTLKWTGRWVVLFVILGTTMFAEVFLLETAVSTSDSGDEDAAIFVISCLLVILLSAGLWVVLTSMMNEVLRDRAARFQRFHRSIEQFNEMFVRAIAGWLFGLRHDKVQVVRDEESAQEEWGGRMKYMEHALERVVAEAKRELKLEIQEAKTELQESIHNVGP